MHDAEFLDSSMLYSGANRLDATRILSAENSGKQEVTRVTSTMEKLRGKLQKSSKDVCADWFWRGKKLTVYLVSNTCPIFVSL